MKRKTSPLVLVALVGLIAGCAGTGDDVCSMAVDHLESCLGVTFPESTEIAGACDPEQAQRVLGISCSELGGVRDSYLFGGGLGMGGLGGLLGSLFGGGGMFGGGGADGDFGPGDLFSLLGGIIDMVDGNDNNLFGGSSSACKYQQTSGTCYCYREMPNNCSGNISGLDCGPISNTCYCRTPVSSQNCGGMSGSSGCQYGCVQSASGPVCAQKCPNSSSLQPAPAQYCNYKCGDASNGFGGSFGGSSGCQYQCVQSASGPVCAQKCPNSSSLQPAPAQYCNYQCGSSGSFR